MCCHLSLSLSEGGKSMPLFTRFGRYNYLLCIIPNNYYLRKPLHRWSLSFSVISHITLQPLIVNSNFQQITSHSQKNWLSRANLHEHRMASSIPNSGQPNRNFYMRRETSQHRFWLLKNKVDEQWSLFVIDPQIAIKEIGKPWLLIAYCHK